MLSATNAASQPAATSNPATLAAYAKELAAREIAYIANPRFDEDAAEQLILGTPLDLPQAGEISAAAGRLPSHLARLCEMPLLDHPTEADLFCRMNYLLHQANSIQKKLRAGHASRARVSKIESLLGKSQQIKQHIAAANIRLVVSIVKQLAGSVGTFDDLLSDGLVAMMRAVERFDFDRGFRFSTYATMVVRRQLYRSMKNSQRDRTRFPNEQYPFQEQPAIETDKRIDFQGWRQLSGSLASIIRQLDPREQQIIRARFGFDTDGKKQTLQSLANEFGVCKERVRQLEKRAMSKLRAYAEGAELHAFVDLD